VAQDRAARCTSAKGPSAGWPLSARCQVPTWHSRARCQVNLALVHETALCATGKQRAAPPCTTSPVSGMAAAVQGRPPRALATDGDLWTGSQMAAVFPSVNIGGLRFAGCDCCNLFRRWLLRRRADSPNQRPPANPIGGLGGLGPKPMSGRRSAWRTRRTDNGPAAAPELDCLQVWVILQGL
jgi:hypothetical protein